MKYIKTFENNYSDFFLGNTENKPNIGDYILCETKYKDSELTYFLSNNIGRVIDETIRDDNKIMFLIEYENLPKELSINTSNPPNRWIGINFIKYLSKDKNDIEEILTAKTYNL